MPPAKPNSPFPYLFAAVLSLTLTAGGTALHLASQPTLTSAQERFFDSAIALWTTGTTTLIGLLSSRSHRNDDGPSNG
jgi:hypothetical protein